MSRNSGGDMMMRNQHLHEFEAPLPPGSLLWDVDLARIEEPLPTRERCALQLQAANEMLQRSTDQAQSRFLPLRRYFT